jgi:hypothetical protein
MVPSQKILELIPIKRSKKEIRAGRIVKESLIPLSTSKNQHQESVRIEVQDKMLGMR